MTQGAIHELDVVALTARADRWPAGTVGTVLEVWPSLTLVELSDERGRTQDFLTLAPEILRHVRDGDPPGARPTR